MVQIRKGETGTAVQASLDAIAKERDEVKKKKVGWFFFKKSRNNGMTEVIQHNDGACLGCLDFAHLSWLLKSHDLSLNVKLTWRCSTKNEGASSREERRVDRAKRCRKWMKRRILSHGRDVGKDMSRECSMGWGEQREQYWPLFSIWQYAVLTTHD